MFFSFVLCLFCFQLFFILIYFAPKKNILRKKTVYFFLKININQISKIRKQHKNLVISVIVIISGVSCFLIDFSVEPYFLRGAYFPHHRINFI